jgi:hypothetical protein
MNNKSEHTANASSTHLNGAPAPEPSSLPVAGPAKMLKVSKRTAGAIRQGIEHANAAAVAVQIAEDRLKQARQAFQSVANTNQGYVVALIEDGGQRPEDYGNFGLWEEGGEIYLRATPAAGN